MLSRPSLSWEQNPTPCWGSKECVLPWDMCCRCAAGLNGLGWYTAIGSPSCLYSDHSMLSVLLYYEVAILACNGSVICTQPGSATSTRSPGLHEGAGAQLGYRLNTKIKPSALTCVGLSEW
jgi:hypothetical protein